MRRERGWCGRGPGKGEQSFASEPRGFGPSYAKRAQSTLQERKRIKIHLRVALYEPTQRAEPTTGKIAMRVKRLACGELEEHGRVGLLREGRRVGEQLLTVVAELH